MPTERRPATREEAKAMANPVRMRLLRLCLDEPLTNKQLADRLGMDPGTVLHHVRTLLATGFLEVDAVRHGERGALEKPYRATGKTWRLEVDDPEAAGDLTRAVLQAFSDEVLSVDDDAVMMMTRFAPRLGPVALEEFATRLKALVLDFAERNDDDGVALGVLFGVHIREFPVPAWLDDVRAGGFNRPPE